MGQSNRVFSTRAEYKELKIFPLKPDKETQYASLQFFVSEAIFGAVIPIDKIKSSGRPNLTILDEAGTAKEIEGKFQLKPGVHYNLSLEISSTMGTNRLGTKVPEIQFKIIDAKPA